MNSHTLRRLCLHAAALTLALPAAAQADQTTVSSFDNFTGTLSAGSGLVALSELQADGQWHLVTFKDGTRNEPQVATRPAEFDLDVGTDAAGKPVITYSRCKKYASVEPRSWLLYRTADTGCRLAVLDLATGKERILKVPNASRSSDTTPSMYRGNLAFGRRVGTSKLMTVMRLTRGGRLLKTAQGTTQPACGTGAKGKKICPPKIKRGDVSQLDLGARSLAYGWRVVDGAVCGVGAEFQLRGVDLKSGFDGVFDWGMSSGTGGGSVPFSPQATETGIRWGSLRYEAEGMGRWITSFGSATVGKSSQLSTVLQPEARAFAAAVDGDTLYTLRGSSDVLYADPGKITLNKEPLPSAQPKRQKITKGTIGC